MNLIHKLINALKNWFVDKSGYFATGFIITGAHSVEMLFDNITDYMAWLVFFAFGSGIGLIVAIIGTFVDRSRRKKASADLLREYQELTK